MILRAADGTLLSTESLPSKKKAKGALLVIHGMGEHSGRHHELAEQAHELGLNVFLIDLRGHGKSQGVRGHFSSWEVLLSDLDIWVSHLVDAGELKEEQPCFLLGHSLGGLLALTFAARFPAKPLYPHLRGVFLSSPALGLTPLRKLQHQLALKLPSPLGTLQIPTGIQPRLLSHDKAEVAAYQNDPLVHPWITPTAFLAMNVGIRGLRKLIPSLKVPVFILLGGRDKIVDVRAAEIFAKKLQVAHPTKVELKVFHTFYHEPFHETKRERAFLEFKKWILKTLPRTSPQTTARNKKSSSRSSEREVTGKVSLN